MSEEEIASDSAVAVIERPEEHAEVREAPAAPAPAKKRKKKDEDDRPDYELGFDTPFGSLELEVEPQSNKEKREARKQQEAEAAAEKAAAKAAAKAAKRAAKHPKPGAESRGHGLLIAFVIFSVIAAAIVLAFWLFARPGEEEPEVVPEEFRNREAEPVVAAEAPGALASIQQRIRTAIRAGRRASREAQQEQEKRFRQMTRS
jgi:hypothetical protein